MPYYSFYVKKGKYQVEMTSDDIYFAKRQVDKLFEKLVKKQGKLRVVLPPIDPEKIKNEQKELEKTGVIKETTPEKEKQAVKTEKAIEITKKTAQEKSAELKQQQLFSEEDEAVIEEADKLLKEELREKEDEAVIEEVDKLLHEELREKEDEAVIEEIDKLLHEELLTEEIEEDSAENLFENILAKKTLEINENIEELEEEQQKQPVKHTTGEKKKFSFKTIIREPLKASNHDEASSRRKAELKASEAEEEEEDEEIARIIEEKIKKNLPKSEDKIVFVDTATEQEITSVEIDEPDVIYTELYEDNNLMTQDFETMEELIAIKKPQSKLDYLLLTAYYLQTKEDLFKYSLKQLNSKSMPFLGSLIDHSVIHNAVAHDFIEVVPDYNGTAEVTEYRLTPVGEDYLLS